MIPQNYSSSRDNYKSPSSFFHPKSIYICDNWFKYHVCFRKGLGDRIPSTKANDNICAKTLLKSRMNWGTSFYMSRCCLPGQAFLQTEEYPFNNKFNWNFISYQLITIFMNIATTCTTSTYMILLIKTTYVCSKPVQPVFKREYHMHIELFYRV